MYTEPMKPTDTPTQALARALRIDDEAPTLRDFARTIIELEQINSTAELAQSTLTGQAFVSIAATLPDLDVAGAALARFYG
jgi:hypothetical protein